MHGGKKKVSVESKVYSYDNIFTKEKKKQLPVRTVLGIDIGSRHVGLLLESIMRMEQER